jgi:hypothetical protein
MRPLRLVKTTLTLRAGLCFAQLSVTVLFMRNRGKKDRVPSLLPLLSYRLLFLLRIQSQSVKPVLNDELPPSKQNVRPSGYICDNTRDEK